MEITNELTALYCGIDDFLDKAWTEQQQRAPIAATLLKAAVVDILTDIKNREAQMTVTERLIWSLALIERTADYFKGGLTVAAKMEGE